MTIKSMTGYGKRKSCSGSITAVVELKSVNHKQFDSRLNLPRTLMFAESRILKYIHKRIARGFVTCGVTVEVSSKFRKQRVAVDEPLAQAYVTRLRKVGGHLGIKDDLSLGMLLTMPKVVRFEDSDVCSGKLLPIVLESLKHALSALIAMRASEGKTLQQDIDARLEKLQSMFSRIEKRAPGVTKKHRRALRERIQSSGVELNYADSGLLREMAFFADRSDISEELTRLHSHIKQTVEKLSLTVPVGRTLDFLLQEMFREINTIGSKANGTQIVGYVIRFKAELERIREQVQNIE